MQNNKNNSDLLTKLELGLVSRLLGLAAAQFSNHGCNDFLMDMSREDARDILVAVAKHNGDPEEVAYWQDATRECSYGIDAALMRFMADRLSAAARAMGAPLKLLVFSCLICGDDVIADEERRLSSLAQHVAITRIDSKNCKSCTKCVKEEALGLS